MDPIYIGSIFLFAGNFEPKNFAFCDGRLMSIAQNTALFAILGTTYGGDGKVTFALPDLRGRVAVGVGAFPGGQSWSLGEAQGTNAVTLTQENLAVHSHNVNANNGPGGNDSPSNSVLAEIGTSLPPLGPYTQGAPNTTMSAHSVMPAGSGFPVGIMQPYLGLNYIIALYGVFPPRS
ncbi:MAG: phage tail protein [Deltaproteobacteria bacterium]|nr:phage tail protein [Deltaproteobacteria bacterium]